MWCRAATPPPCRPARKPRSALVPAVLTRRPSHGGPRVRILPSPPASPVRTVEGSRLRRGSNFSHLLPLAGSLRRLYQIRYQFLALGFPSFIKSRISLILTRSSRVNGALSSPIAILLRVRT